MPNSTVKGAISIVVPLHNEAGNIFPLHAALSHTIKNIPYDFNFIFVNDGSTDKSSAFLDAVTIKDPRVQVLEFSRNFGKEAAVSAGLHVAKSDAVIIMDGDLQHPPALIKTFIRKWERGADVVIGVRKYGNEESAFKRFTSGLYYKLINMISHTMITPHATDYRLMDSSVVEAFGALTERNRMTRGIIDWLGFKKEYISFVSPPRQHGDASYTYKKLVGLALNSVTAYSLIPLKLAGYVGLIILFVTGPVGVFVFVENYLMHDPYHLHITGTATLGILLLFLIGIVLACLGLIALYIGQIHIEVTNRPLYVLRKRRSFEIRNRNETAEENPVIDENETTQSAEPGITEELEVAS
jgi:glycosyltransferase involved in cell wall biosynthesis